MRLVGLGLLIALVGHQNSSKRGAVSACENLLLQRAPPLVTIVSAPKECEQNQTSPASMETKI
jgi:hypothetical protein